MAEIRASQVKDNLAGLLIQPQSGYTQVIVMTSDGRYTINALSELDMMFRQYPESIAQLLGDDIEAAFRKHRERNKP